MSTSQTNSPGPLACLRCSRRREKEEGAIQASATDSTLFAMLSAKTRALKHMRRMNPELDDHDLIGKMTLYCCDQASHLHPDDKSFLWSCMRPHRRKKFLPYVCGLINYVVGTPLVVSAVDLIRPPLVCSLPPPMPGALVRSKSSQGCRAFDEHAVDPR